MSARALAFVLLSLVGCKKQEEPAAAAASTPPDRRARCERIGEQMTQMGLLVARGLVSGLSEGKQQLEQDTELKAGLDTARAELVEDCMSWSDETLDCFGISGVLESEKCERLLAEALGDTPPPPAAPPGPPPTWTASLPEDLALLHGCVDGSALIVVERGTADDDDTGTTLLSIAGGKTRWSKPLAASPWSLEPLDETSALVVLPDELVAIAIADGSERWRAKLPAGDEPQIRALLRERDQLLLLDDDRRVMRVELSRCKTGACIEVVGALATDDPESTIGLDLSGELQLARLADGGLVIAAPDEHRAVVLDDQLHPRFAFESRAGLSWVRARGDELVVAQDGELLGLAPGACGDKGKTFAPATWPPPGEPSWLREITAREGMWSDTPAGCVRWRRALTIAELIDAPVPDVGDTMIVQGGGMLFAITPSAELWKSSVAAQSLAVVHGDAIAVLGDVGDGDTQLAMMWLSPADGHHVAHTEIALGKGQYFVVDGPQLVSAGALVIAGYDRELVAFGR